MNIGPGFMTAWGTNPRCLNRSFSDSGDQRDGRDRLYNLTTLYLRSGTVKLTHYAMNDRMAGRL